MNEEAEVKVKVSVDDKSVKDFGKNLEKETAKSATKASKELDKLTKAAADTRAKMGKEFADVGKDIGRSLANGIKLATGAAAIGAGAIIKGNMDAEKSFRRVSFAAKAGGNDTIGWSKIQAKAFELTKKWGGSQEELASAMAETFKKSGDANYSLRAMESLAKTGRASGEDMKNLGTIAGELNAKFGITGDELDDALARVLELGNKGGMSVEEIAGSFDAMGKSASRAGVQGVEGFTKMMALSTKMGDAVGGETAALSQLSKILAKIGPTADAKMKAKLKALGVTGKDSMEVLGNLMKKTGGDAGKLEGVVGQQGAAFLSTGLGKSGFDEAMAEAAKSTLKGSDVAKSAADNMQMSSAKIEVAMATIAERFARPDAMHAIDQLMDALPKLANAAVQGVDIIGKHPYLAGGALLASQSGGAAGSLIGLGSSIMQARNASAALTAAQQAATAAKAAETTEVVATTAATTKTTGSIASLGAAAVATAAAMVAVGVAVDQYRKLHKEVDEGGLDPVGSAKKAGHLKETELQLEAMKKGDAQRLRDMAENEKHFRGSTGANDQSIMGRTINAQVDEKYRKMIETAEAVGNINKNYRERAEREQGNHNPLRTLNDVAAYKDEVSAANKKLRKAGGGMGADGKFVKSDFQWATPGSTGAPPSQQPKPDAGAKAMQDLPARLATTQLQVKVINTGDFRSDGPGRPRSIFDSPE